MSKPEFIEFPIIWMVEEDEDQVDRAKNLGLTYVPPEPERGITHINVNQIVSMNDIKDEPNTTSVKMADGYCYKIPLNTRQIKRVISDHYDGVRRI